MTDLQYHPIFFFQIKFIYLFFTGKPLLLHHKSCHFQIANMQVTIVTSLSEECCHCYKFIVKKKK